MKIHFAAAAARCAFAGLLAASLSPEGLAQDEGGELVQAQAQYRRDVEFATKAIRDRYLSRLDGLKRKLGARGETRAAVEIQDEIDRVNAAIPDENLATAATKLAGIWKITFITGEVRTYGISPDGFATAYNVDAAGVAASSTRKKMTLKGGDVLIEFQEGAIERLKISGGRLLVEHFYPKTLYPHSPPKTTGTGVPTTVRKS